MTRVVDEPTAGAVPQPEIKGSCRRCEKSTVLPWLDAMLTISPGGIEHFGHLDGTTACGIDATGDGWWWPW